MNNSEYKLAIIELFYPIKHLDCLYVTKHINNGNYILELPLSLRNFYNKKLIDMIIKSYKIFYQNKFVDFNFDYHYFHPNFKNIIANENYFNIKIIKIIYINYNKIIIDKTFYLKIFQRKFRKYFHQKKSKINFSDFNHFYDYSLDYSDDSTADSSSTVSLTEESWVES